jgi:hypothetical protein
MKTQFAKEGLVEGTSELRFFLNLDRALEWCENELLVAAKDTGKHPATSGLPAKPEEEPSDEGLRQALLEIYPNPQPIMRLLAAMQYRTLAPARESDVERTDANVGGLEARRGSDAAKQVESRTPGSTSDVVQTPAPATLARPVTIDAAATRLGLALFGVLPRCSSAFAAG